MLYKTIIQGKINFGTQKAYDMAVKMYISRAEKYHKNDVLFLPEEIFFPEELSMIIPRLVKQVYDKSFKNTSALLEYIVQFGLSGEMDIWQLDSGKILHFKHLEPSSDKVAVQQYIKGKKLAYEEGKEEEAIAALNKAIERYDEHAQAYERRGKVNFILKKFHDALRDYNKCLGLDPNNPYAHYGKAMVLLNDEKLAESIESFQSAIKKSVALQPIHWNARRNKGKLHIELEQYPEAEFELKLFANRVFPTDNSNFLWNREGHFLYGRVLLALEKYSEAVEQFEKALDIDEGNDTIPKAEMLRYRGMAKQKAGQNGYIKDIKDAAELGDTTAVELLKEIA